MIRTCRMDEIERIFTIVNEAAKVYEGSIPPDCYRQPYMSLEELKHEMKRVIFFGWEENGQLIGVMGLELSKGVSLIRHAYVLPGFQSKGIGSQLLKYILVRSTTSRLMVGTWAAATWAIDFYKKHGFSLMNNKEDLLSTYWEIPPRQIETSVVLAKSAHC
jgi:N-acetylglutamate synthase-like GNAT family acetyltransferase